MLDYLPLTESVKLIKTGEVDAWGEPLVDRDNARDLACMIRSVSENAQAIPGAKGNMVVPSYKITVCGRVDVKIGDIILVDGREFDVINIHAVKDLSREVAITNITI